jgi:hypothetical protein
MTGSVIPGGGLFQAIDSPDPAAVSPTNGTVTYYLNLPPNQTLPSAWTLLVKMLGASQVTFGVIPNGYPGISKTVEELEVESFPGTVTDPRFDSSASIYARYDNQGIGIATPTYNVTFTESGLPPETGWSIGLAGYVQNSTSTSMSFLEWDGNWSYDVGFSNYYAFPFEGNITVKDKNVTQAVAFSTVPSTYVSFTESGLSSGAEWWVALEGNNQSSTSNMISFPMPTGTFPYNAGASGYNSSPSEGNVTVYDANVTQPITFTSALTPEFPSALFLPFFAATSLLVIALRHRYKLWRAEACR